MKDLIKMVLLIVAIVGIAFAAAELVRRFCGRLGRNYVSVD